MFMLQHRYAVLRDVIYVYIACDEKPSDMESLEDEHVRYFTKLTYTSFPPSWCRPTLVDWIKGDSPEENKKHIHTCPLNLFVTKQETVLSEGKQ